ncbi:pyruvate kinase [Pontibacter sp. 172403-2]|uniref:pyruvate kinase n=1 Tax=Pontibacter rufus TaxID=2791028 RepID=UPI0018AFD4B8|nr:pyruvate kinase [Pontibacter sp. 172403-2]MBF9251986.1 pyruvate kinase [Pontibacter sp. 172403-2]
MPHNEEHYKALIAQLDQLHQQALELEQKFEPLIEKAHPNFRNSARNLLHYLALRQHDIRELQESLAQLGLSSLGRAEAHVLTSLEAVRHQLCHLADCAPNGKPLPVSFSESQALLASHTQDLLGPAPGSRSTRIMVTFSSDLADDYELVCRLMKAGMNCARINCAHDHPEVWLQMVQHVQRASRELNLPCKILMDLMGPKLRTGPLQPGPALLVIRPVQNELGQVTAPAKVWLAPAGITPPVQADATLPLEADWLAQLQQGDTLYFTDTRGRRRQLSVVHKEANGVMAHLLKTSYITTGTQLKVKTDTVASRKAAVGELPAATPPLLLRKDHFLVLTKAPIPGEPARFDAQGHVVQPAHISCTLPEVFAHVKAGQPILFNDGKIEGKVLQVSPDQLLVQITYASDAGSKLRADNGINLPETELHLHGLTEKDKEDLRFVAKHADIVGLSFVNNTAMVEALQQELRQLGATNAAIMLKIETQEAFRNLPHLLLAVMRSYPAGIMIARGDLAVECGWQRLAEVQEEILWLCEAAHLPVVWATQVLETLAKKGRPSRAEITDAAMAQRADCVMLNKGPYIVQAIQLLDDILTRMQAHQHKKTSMLGSLHISDMQEQTE